LGIHTYTLSHIISTNKTIKLKILKDLLKKQSEMINILSIQTYKLKSNINIEEPYPAWFDISMASKKNKKVVGVMLKKTRFQKNICGKKSQTIDDSEIVNIIQSLINTTFGELKNYKNLGEIGIKTIRKSDSSRNECYWATSDSKYCLNVEREHSSAEIYFEIDYDKITQRCYSSKKTTHDRIDGLCKEYKSKKFFPLPIKLKKILFPIKFEENNNKLKSINGCNNDTIDTIKTNNNNNTDFTLSNLLNNNNTNMFEKAQQYNFEYNSDNDDE